MSNDEAEKFLYKGNTHHEAGEFDLAIENYTRALKLNPRLAESFNNRGVVYEKKGEFDQAIEDHTRAIELKPEDARAFYNRGVAYGKKGEYDQAIEDFNQAIELKPEDVKAFYNRGVAYRKTGKEEEAIQDFKRANELDPTVIPKKEVEETKKETVKVQNFQKILEELRDEYEKEEKDWFRKSIQTVIVVSAVLVVLLILTLWLKPDYTTVSPFYIFPSIITFIVIRQYTNAKQLRIEASNRLVMAKMFEKIQQTKDNQHYQDFIPKLIDGIAYPRHKDRTESTVPIIEALKKLLAKNKS